jgi:hypothetical protein
MIVGIVDNLLLDRLSHTFLSVGTVLKESLPIFLATSLEVKVGILQLLVHPVVNRRTRILLFSLFFFANYGNKSTFV